MNLLVNHVWGDKHILAPFHKLYLDSMVKVENCKKLLIVQDVNEENIQKMSEYYDFIEVIKNPSTGYFLEHNLDLTTLKSVEKKSKDFDFVFFSDSFDVVFQSNPFDFFSQYEENLFLTSPGFRVKEQWPDRNWHEYFNKTLRVPESFLEDKVLNGAFVAGKTQNFLDFLVFLITNQNRNGRHVVDQTVFCYYYAMMKDRGTVKILDSREDNFIYHAQNDSLYGIEEKPTVIDGKIYTKQNELYCIWHQWDDIGYTAKLDENGMGYLV